MMKILFASPEIVPFAKTGGLADVSGALPLCLKREGCDIRLITPLYKTTPSAGLCNSRNARSIPVTIGNNVYVAEIWEGTLNNAVKVYFIKCDDFFWREHLYGTADGDYPDNAERFIFLSRCIADFCSQGVFVPDVIHCNDWQTGLVPVYLKTIYADNRVLSGIVTVLTIHNIAYQGVFNKEKFMYTGLPDSILGIDGLEFWGRMNFLKGGILFADVVNTVSETYSREIRTAEFGYGLEGVIAQREKDLYGILNGVDYTEWDPARDRYIAAHYSPRSLWRKSICKKDLAALFDLDGDAVHKPLIGCVSRLVDQKGFDLIVESLKDIMDSGMMLVVLGAGTERYHKALNAAGRRYKGRMGIKLSYDNAVAHKVEAGCDMFLMPSRYEPCGLNQIYSLKYGTVPIVRATGGLDDTIIDCTDDPVGGNGFKFKEYTSAALSATIKRAIVIYRDPRLWKNLMLTCMRYDFSWEKSAAQYVTLYRRAIKKKRTTIE